jgi:hypothetical protein
MKRKPLQRAYAMTTIWNHILLGILLRSQSGDHPIGRYKKENKDK